MINAYETIAEQYLHEFESHVGSYLLTKDINALRDAENTMFGKDIDKTFFEYGRLEDYMTIVQQLIYAHDEGNEKIKKMKEGQLAKFYKNA